MTIWDILDKLVNIFPPIAATVLLIGATVIFIVGFSKHGINFLKYGFKQIGISDLGAKIDNLRNELQGINKRLDGMETRLDGMDSRIATMGLALLVSEAAKSRDAGNSAEQIVAQITSLTQKVRFLAAVNTLKYLQKGGRISATSAMIGEVLGIKPIVTMRDGSIFATGKARGTPAAIKAILHNAQADPPDLRYDVVFAHSCAPQLIEKTVECLQEPLGLTEWLTCSIGSVIGTYAGRGVVGFAYIT